MTKKQEEIEGVKNELKPFDIRNYSPELIEKADKAIAFVQMDTDNFSEFERELAIRRMAGEITAKECAEAIRNHFKNDKE